MSLRVTDILELIGKGNYEVIGNVDQRVLGIASIREANAGDLVFCKKREDAISALPNTKASTIICSVEIDVSKIKNKTLILVEKPKLWFVRVIKRFFPLKPQPAIHPTATINDCVKIGKNVRIGPGCRIGFDGFGYAKNEEGVWENFPHRGGVTLEDDVEVGSNTCIDRGVLSDTIIGKGTKIDNLVHIGHNAKIGRNCVITAQCTMGRSIIGDDVWIGICSSIRPGVNVGKGALIGMGSVVVRDVEEYALVYGVPARFIEKLSVPQLRAKGEENDI